jgi:RNA polymerase sigma-70 factor (ECF subfamily)
LLSYDVSDDADFLHAGRAAWPAITVPTEAFMRYLAERSTPGLRPVERAADLYLACGALLGDGAALAAMHGTLRAEVSRALRRVDGSPALADEVAQILGMKLLVRVGDEPLGLAAYAGRASLRGWLSTSARRTALNLRRNKGDQPHDELQTGVRELGTTAGPELLLLKARYKAEFEDAIRAALATIPVKQRTLLLLHLVNGLTLPQLAAMENVSRATVARWLASAREALHEETRRELTGRLRVSESELNSLVALVRSQVEVSVAELVPRQRVG